ncbi:NAD(P)H-dependent oxidoreductase [Kangiella sediminilitoris]|uniref:NAD(P)H oxidoreductase n=1 Tax=Kangiella sediminilitoris TaxID=1144748 RepID=A0A1B3B9R9_9GAMM|nr:NAD(P)H-dependent oxidoreductase [Kangiella sediminilitoris]AOE49549.1 NAD(P)H oxidoreductase [Kangiella sediminilitoris]
MGCRVLLYLVHPVLEKSWANQAMLEAVKDLDYVKVYDLYEEYPDFFIDVKREQKLLLEHNIIIFQHPFYWYSSPSLLKEWQDQVLSEGFAYGEGGYQLAGRYWLNAITAGAAKDSYAPHGFNNYSARELLRPFEQTADFCGMSFVEPFIMYDSETLSHSACEKEAIRYRDYIKQLVESVYRRENGTSQPDSLEGA